MDWSIVLTAILGVVTTAIGGLGTVLGVLWKKIEATSVAHRECEVKHAKLEGIVEGLKREIDALRVSDTSSVWLISDLSGNIVDIGGRVASLLRYRPTELIGKSINVLIPEELRLLHDQGLQKIVRGGPLRTNAAVAGKAVRSDGTTVNVVISLSEVKYLAEKAIKAELFELLQGS